MEKKKIKIPIFHGELTILKAKDLSEIGKKYKMNFDNFQAVVWKDESKKFLTLFVAVNENVKSDIIAHEAVHLVNHVFINKGIELCRYNDENQAYLTGWFVKRNSKICKMNKEISKILRDKLREGDGLPFVEKYVGLVQTVVRDDPNEGATKKSRFPVATEVFINNICQSNEQIITPDSSLKGFIYFEDNGINPDGRKYVSNLTLICWINRAKIVSNIYSEITGIAIQNILNKIGIDENPENVSMFQGLTVSLTKIFPQEASLFSKYTYDESVTQYLRPPFEFFGLGLQIKYGINSKCIEPISIQNNEVCY